MSQHVPQNEPLEIPRDAYPMVRISSEFFLRSVDLLTRVQGDKLISGLVNPDRASRRAASAGQRSGDLEFAAPAL
ncbi:MAG: hypothetical protein EXR12_00835 [Rhodospirillaceae bacterium]|nr:hypothetical protein [Rhodospirillaceae bacterium]